MITGMDHPAIAADDADALAQWYADVLGYEKTFRMQDKPVWIITAPDGTCIEVMPRDENPRPARTAHTAGFSHLAFRVENLDDAICALDAKGVAWTGEVGDATGGGRVRSFTDPDGNLLQVVER